MPTVIGHHDVKDTDHWLASPKREEFLGLLGVTNIRTFVDPTNKTHVAVLMDVPDTCNDGRDGNPCGRRSYGPRRGCS